MKNQTQSIQQLARLMAQENISVQVTNKPEAWFDLKTRTMQVPYFEGLTQEEVDLFVGHESSHALNTPTDKWHGVIDEIRANQGDAFAGAFKLTMNVVEDARIERDIKSKYPGMKQVFYFGYDNISKRKEFVDLTSIPFEERNIVDRINAHYKFGAHFNFPIDDEMRPWIEEIDKVKNFDDVLEVSNRLYEAYLDELRDQAEQEKGEGDESENSGDGEGEDSGDVDKQDQQQQSNQSQDNPFKEKKKKKKSSDSEKNESEKNSNFSQQNSKNDSQEELQKKIEKSLKDSLQNKIDNFYNNSVSSDTIINLTLPKVNLENIVIPFNEILNTCREQVEKNQLDQNSINIQYKIWFKKERTTVAHYTRQFKQLAEADVLSRTQHFKTGRIDTDRLSLHRVSDNIFLTNEVVTTGKNHGFVIILDMSGSMSSSMKQTTTQLLRLVSFCRDNNIPHRVYGFNDSWCVPKPSGSTLDQYEGDCFNTNTGAFLEELFSDKMTKKEFEEMANYMIAAYTKFYNQLSAFVLGGTPLAEAIVCTPELARQLKNSYSLQHVHVVNLTDGADTNLQYFVSQKILDLHNKNLRRNSNWIIQDATTRKTFPTYSVPLVGSHGSIFEDNTGKRKFCNLMEVITDCVRSILNDMGASFMNFYIDHCNDFYHVIENEFVKAGYNEVFVIDPSCFSITNNNAATIEDLNKNMIANSKKKVMIDMFIEMIAGNFKNHKNRLGAYKRKLQRN